MSAPSLRQGDFLKLWSAETISAFGSQVSLLALPLAAALTLRATPLQMGILTALGTAPTLVFGLLAGAWVDRVRRRPLLITVNVTRSILLLTVPIAALLHVLRIEQLYGIEVLAGLCTIVNQVATTSFLPSVVAPSMLLAGNSRLETSRAIAGTAGPGLAGALVQLLTAPIAILADSAAYLLSAVVLSRIRTVEPAGRAGGSGSLRREIAEGWRLVVRNPILRPLTLGSATFNLFDSVLLAVYVLYMVRALALGPGAVGVVFGLGGIGAIAGSVLAQPLAVRLGLGPVMIAGIVVAGIAELGIGLVHGPLGVRLATLVMAEGGVQMGATVYKINAVSVRQIITPAALLGRVSATVQVAGTGTGAIGAIAGGLLGTMVGLRETVLIAGAGTLLSFLWVIASPVRSLVTATSDVPVAPDTPSSLSL